MMHLATHREIPWPQQVPKVVILRLFLLTHSFNFIVYLDNVPGPTLSSLLERTHAMLGSLVGKSVPRYNNSQF